MSPPQTSQRGCLVLGGNWESPAACIQGRKEGEGERKAGKSPPLAQRSCPALASGLEGP